MIDHRWTALAVWLVACTPAAAPPTPTPTPTPAPSPTPTPTPAPSPAPSPTPTPTAAPSPAPTPTPTAAPTFSLPAISGTATARIEPGKVNVVAFVASWCAPCQRELPKLEVLFGRYKARGLAVVAMGEDDDANDLGAFAAPLHLTFPVAHDAGKTVATAWHLNAMPSTVLVDKHGAIRFTRAGYSDGDEADLERRIQRLLAE